MRWVLPDHIQDALPSDAHRLESLAGVPRVLEVTAAQKSEVRRT